MKRKTLLGLLGCIFLANSGLLSAQAAKKGKEARERGLKWPGDKDRKIAEVFGKPVTLGDLVESLEKNYSPGCSRIFSGPLGTRTMDLSLPVLLRLDLDLRVVRAEAKRRGITISREEIEKEIKKRFEELIQKTVWSDPTKEAQVRATKDYRLKVFRRTEGPRVEIDLLLSRMVPKKFSMKELRKFYQENGLRDEMQIKIAHIFISRYDPETGHLLSPEGIRRRNKRIERIKALLKPDGSNFEDIAEKYSDMKKTAARGGFLGYVERWGQKHEAIARAAFELKQNEWTGPIEEPEGFHFIKCLKILSKGAIYVVSQIKDKLTEDMIKQKKEDLLYELRRKAKARMLL